MPELPDLEVFSKNLNHTIGGKQLTGIQVIFQKKLNVSADELAKVLVGTKLLNIKREGKELFFHFSNKSVLAMHMMLHGKLYYFKEENNEKYSLVELYFEGGQGLVLTDFQKQAKITLNPKPDKAPDAFSKEFSLEYFKGIVSKNKSGIKKLLTDPKFVRGIGNAYADEILWESRVHPISVCNQIPNKVIEKLYDSIDLVLKNAIKKISTSHPDIIGGEIRDFLNIHNRKKVKSPTGAEIKKETINGRGTYFTDEQIQYK